MAAIILLFARTLGCATGADDDDAAAAADDDDDDDDDDATAVNAATAATAAATAAAADPLSQKKHSQCTGPSQSHLTFVVLTSRNSTPNNIDQIP